MRSEVISEQLTIHLKEKWQGRTCLMCQSSSWTIADMIFELREFNHGQLIIGGGPVIPIIPVTCDGCGNTLFIDAVRTGIVDYPRR